MVRYRVRSPSERPHLVYRQQGHGQQQGCEDQEPEQGLSSERFQVSGRTHRGHHYRRRRCSRRRLYRVHRRRRRSCRRRRRRCCRRGHRRGCRRIRRRRRCRRY
ncbi:protamine-2 [Trichechus inunguis]